MTDGMRSSVSDAEYHGDRDTLSSTGARLLLPPSCPAKFKQWRDNPPLPKREYTIGHVVHALVLGKGLDIVEVHATDYRTKDARDARDKALADGHAPVLTHELMQCHAMAGAVLNHPTAGPLFEGKGESEVSFYGTDPATGVRLRARVDRMHFADDGRVWLVDLKTDRNAYPAAFVRDAANHGYHFQAAWYLMVIQLLKLAASPAFVFPVVEKEPPYLVSVVEFDAEAIAEGTRLCRQAIDVYHDCQANDTWPGYDADITPISLPPWAFNRGHLNELIDITD